MVDIPKDIMNSHGIREKSILEIEKSVQNSLMVLKNQAEKIMDSYERYCKCEDLALRDDLIEYGKPVKSFYTGVYGCNSIYQSPVGRIYV